ncbi:hypothetical protein B0H63DRAFT_307240 [Podospora didyma]|uniref:Uncharacterized protein n=1 Tax=Podospora didyma TaxID=330526 RepID=A0AAE0N4M9_9PEZI|nr:hypothetical protein B0H63DRAFT_307240 [Podospora didyma]
MGPEIHSTSQDAETKPDRKKVPASSVFAQCPDMGALCSHRRLRKMTLPVSGRPTATTIQSIPILSIFSYSHPRSPLLLGDKSRKLLPRHCTATFATRCYGQFSDHLSRAATEMLAQGHTRTIETRQRASLLLYCLRQNKIDSFRSAVTSFEPLEPPPLPPLLLFPCHVETSQWLVPTALVWRLLFLSFLSLRLQTLESQFIS